MSPATRADAYAGTGFQQERRARGDGRATIASTAPPTTHRQHPQDNTETALSKPAGTATNSAARMASFQEIPWARGGAPGGRTAAISGFALFLLGKLELR